ncbi:hypothetical protein AMS68_004850 [Peltaster fructicola]|uniref:Uncharacterized protein n=1 Tax=Peltaster fructicola TaxID=286661 RepID=A0A6H0XX56_9PEZI|nr:hypothetical protein AMS68_004850 [Peltaster fructicola]
MGSIEEPLHLDVLNIIDIRSDAAGIELKEEIRRGLNPAPGCSKTLPTLLLYDAVGLKLFETITYLDEYYLTNEEINVLETYAIRIAERIPDGAILLELGSGNLRKIKILLGALDAMQKRIDYYALDLDESELKRTLSAIPEGTFKHVTCSGLHGTYDDGLEWLQRSDIKARPKTVLSMGSSIGNFNREDAAQFVRRFTSLLSDRDSFLIALDGCQDSDKVTLAYNDRDDVTARFTINGLQHANDLLGKEVFHLDSWTAFGKYDAVLGAHQAFVSPKVDVEVLGVAVAKGEWVRIEESYKYSPTQAAKLWQDAGAVESTCWLNKAGDYGLHMIKAANGMSASQPNQYAAHPVPSLDEWQALWKVWDIVTLQMIPNGELKSKPIKLRNACIFYLGHIPTFLDMKLTQGLGLPATEPKYYHSIFERGIDPDVDNPEHCHAHSEIPEEWPPLEDILQYQARVRARVTEMYTSGLAYETSWAGRVLWLGLEHEAMHLETLLYMLIQSDKTLPPASEVHPDFEQLAGKAAHAAIKQQWVKIPAQTVTMGLDDPDSRDGPLRYFGWDVEKPVRSSRVKAFQASSRPITNEDYAEYLAAVQSNNLPASWTVDEDNAGCDPAMKNKAVKTVFGPVPLQFARHWPVAASYDELAGCAAWMGGRIPTLEETRSLYDYAARQKEEALNALQGTIPAVNGHLVNEGVEESPPSKSLSKASNGDIVPDSSKTFVDLSDANVGFKHWHPMPVTGSSSLAGQAEMGGVWEWTSSTLERQDGFEPMELYPAYSADFFDGKHNIVLGGSWATHPRLAGRKSFVNWYQRNYPYVWAGARVVRDL